MAETFCLIGLESGSIQDRDRRERLGERKAFFRDRQGYRSGRSQGAEQGYEKRHVRVRPIYTDMPLLIVERNAKYAN